MQEHLYPALLRALDQARLTGRGARLLAAVSGGSDSVALLHALHGLQAEMGYILCAVHVEHGLRGDHSLADASFVHSLCHSLGVPLLTYHACLTGGMDEPAAEQRARDARRHFFHLAMQKTHADAVLLAHHMDDQAETVLMRLLRGAGAQGLGGMRPLVPFGEGLLLRPFLDLPREILTDALLRNGLSWREDESNAEPCCLRNRVRHTLLPLLAQEQPQLARHLAQAAQSVQWDEDCLHAQAEDLLTQASYTVPPLYALRKSPLLQSPPAVAVRALRIFVERAIALSEMEISFPGLNSLLSFETSRMLYALLQSAGGLNLPCSLRAEMGRCALYITYQTGEPLRAVPLRCELPLCADQSEYRLGSSSFKLTPAERNPSIPNGRQAVLLSEKQVETACLRLPRSGDRFRAFGAPGSKPLRRYLTDHHVDLPLRPCLPLLAQQDQVLWIPGLNSSEMLRQALDDSGPLWLLTSIHPFPHLLLNDQKE